MPKEPRRVQILFAGHLQAMRLEVETGRPEVRVRIARDQLAIGEPTGAR